MTTDCYAIITFKTKSREELTKYVTWFTDWAIPFSVTYPQSNVNAVKARADFDKPISRHKEKRTVRELIVEFLRARGGQSTVGDLDDYLTSLGFKPRATLTSAISELSGQGVVENVHRGRKIGAHNRIIRLMPPGHGDVTTRVRAKDKEETA